MFEVGKNVFFLLFSLVEKGCFEASELSVCVSIFRKAHIMMCLKQESTMPLGTRQVK